APPMPLEASVVVPCFCRPHLVEEGLKWFARQTFPHELFEVLLIDDSGPENYHLNREVFARAKMDFGLRYFTTGLPKEVYGVTVARNIGTREARAPLIVMTDDDCFCHPNMIEEHVKWHRETDRLMLTGYRSDTPDVLEQPLPVRMTREKCIREHEKSLSGDLGPGDFKTGNASVKKRHLEEVGGFNEEMARANEYGYTDRELAMRLLANRMIFKINPNAAVYVIPTDAATAAHREEHRAADKARERFQAIEKRFKRGRLLDWLLRPFRRSRKTE
ncbi:MAG: glycosyltransferase, partial [Planctomycetota bacterium]|nr:glycosyltransferase [Planctomycetota bacterium]